MKKPKLYDVVKQLLTDYPTLRNSDKLLIWNVFGSLDLLDNGLVATVIRKENFLKAPSTESIRRVRQKIQEKYPDLRSSKATQKAKDIKEKTKGNFVFQESA